MKRYSLMLICFCFLLFFIQICKGQSNIAGTWEGIFMDEFLTRINFSITDENKVEGHLKMFAGDNQIQDDSISRIELVGNRLTFYIPSKETSFQGSFDDLISELIGEFVFPDGTKHAIRLKINEVEKATQKEFRILKETKIEPEKLHSDLLFLYSSLKNHHPRLHAFISKDSLDLLFDSVNNEINRPLTLENFYFQTSKLTHAVGCSHTGVRLPSKYQTFVNEFGSHFPLRLFFSEGKAFYISGISENNHSVQPGCEVLSINDRPVDEIIKQIFFYIPSEGCNTTTKYNEINKKFNQLFYFVDDSKEFRVKFQTQDAIHYEKVSSVRFTDLNLTGNIDEDRNQVDFSLVEDQSLGYLKVKSFAVRDMDRYFFQLDSVFTELEKHGTHSLILDLRDNSGGHPIFGAQLLSYFADKDFVYFKRNEEIKEFEPLYNPMQPNSKRFSGKVYVFINGGCLSTTGHLISLLKYYTKAIFVGEEPGSSFTCNDFSITITLPNSGIVMNVPRTSFTTAVNGFTLGEPFPLDYPVKISPIDVIDGKDPYMEMVKTELDN